MRPCHPRAGGGPPSVTGRRWMGAASPPRKRGSTTWIPAFAGMTRPLGAALPCTFVAPTAGVRLRLARTKRPRARVDGPCCHPRAGGGPPSVTGRRWMRPASPPRRRGLPSVTGRRWTRPASPPRRRGSTTWIPAFAGMTRPLGRALRHRALLGGILLGVRGANGLGAGFQFSGRRAALHLAKKPSVVLKNRGHIGVLGS